VIASDAVLQVFQAFSGMLQAYVLSVSVVSDVLPSSKKECNYMIHTSQISSSLTKFIVNSINIYVSK
jgi:hypothetical protein